MLRVRIAVKMGCPWISQLTQKYGGVTLLQCVPRATQNGVSALVKVKSSVKVEEIEETVRQVNSIEEASFTQINKGVFLGIVRTNSCPCANTVLPHYNFIRAISEHDGFLRWTLLVSNGRSLSRLTSHLQRRKIEYKVEEVAKVDAGSPLTAKQEQILNMALNLGFYNVPRKIGLDELARLSGTSPRAVSEVLRRAHRNLVEQAIG